MNRVADSLASSLESRGVSVIMGVIGGSIMPLYDALYHHESIEVLMFRHEQGAAHAADAYGRITGRPGVVLTTSGPGATNILTGLANAYMDSSPVLAITGQVPTEVFGRDAFQEADIFGMAAPVTKFTYQVRDPGEAVPAVDLAYRISTSGRPGPVLIDLPRDVQVAEARESRELPIEISKYLPPRPEVERVREACRLLLRAERPVMLVGGGVGVARAHDEVLALAEMLSIPVVTTLMGKAALPSSHPLVLGVAGMHGRPEADAALANADLVLALGTRFSDRTVGSFGEISKKVIVHVDLDPSELGKNVRASVPVLGDVKEVLRMMIELVRDIEVRRDDRYLSWLREIRREFERSLEEWAKDFRGMVPWMVLKTLRRVLPADSITVTGVGSHQMWTELHWDVLVPGTFITSAGLGTMGFGIPASLGAKIAARERRVLCIDGDGSFQMTFNNLALVREYSLPFIEVVFNNRALMLVKHWQRFLYGGRIIATEFRRSPDLEGIARAYEIEYSRPESYEELASKVEWAARNDEPLIVDLLMDSETDIVLPWVQPGKWLTEAVLPPRMEVSLEWRG
ncbi:MAG: biosynthetic-type acetolactate synthase large subunit [Candidatus Korarchaeota archaeon NZ13-K]|nr:MAG: biosynthetic-type acetolactate synthase large subunit [Candidatus Korarchaeota archaeon NZ13-K]